jgi:hypothetical protein
MRTGQGEFANRRRSVFLSHTIAAQTDFPCRAAKEGSSSVLLILLLILDDLRLFQALIIAEDNFKSSCPIANKRHTNAHQPSPPSQQRRLQSPLSAIAKVTPFPDSDGGLENRPTFHRVFLAKNKVVLENLRAI